MWWCNEKIMSGPKMITLSSCITNNILLNIKTWTIHSNEEKETTILIRTFGHWNIFFYSIFSPCNNHFPFRTRNRFLLIMKINWFKQKKWVSSLEAHFILILIVTIATSLLLIVKRAWTINSNTWSSTSLNLGS